MNKLIYTEKNANYSLSVNKKNNIRIKSNCKIKFMTKFHNLHFYEVI